MRIVLWSLRILVFLFLLAFALKNTDPVSIRFFLDSAWDAPLIIVVLAFFAGGVLLGVLSLIGTVFSLRRELARLRRATRGEPSGSAGSASQRRPPAGCRRLRRAQRTRLTACRR